VHKQVCESFKIEGSSEEEVGQDILTPIFRRSMFWAPERRALSHWIEHVPFAFWLVDALRPRTIVELGTYNGVSYSAMCQAVKSLGLATSCFAIDTWKGEEYMGLYTEDVYRDFTAFHDQNYGAFSHLVRATFDEALPHFEDGSIDLLHIDGVHTYDAVKHDYQSWLPKLSSNAIVLFHDTNVREREFGVSRLWSELTAEKPHFSFLHGYGLGVLGQGRSYSGALGIVLSASHDSRLVSSIRETFAALGRSARALSERPGLDQSLAERTSEVSRLQQALAAREAELGTIIARQKASSISALAAHEAELATREAELATREAELTTLRHGLSESAGELSRLRRRLAAREAELAMLRHGLSESTDELSRLRPTLVAREAELATLRHGLWESTEELSRLRQTLAAREARVGSLEATVSALYASTSWHITKPLRAARRLSARLYYSRLGYPLALAWQAIMRRSLAPLRNWPAEQVIERSGLFDKEWYLKQNPDVSEWWHSNPVRHYVVFGAKERRDPSRSFSTQAYLEHNPDVAAAAVNPLAHFILHGVAEGRKSYPLLNARVDDHGVRRSSMGANSSPRSVRIGESVWLQMEYRLKRLLGPRISANLSRVLATMRLSVGGFRNLRAEARRGANLPDAYREAYLIHARDKLGEHSSHYGSRIARPPPTERCDVRLIAYYLPQYHPIPENDQWWGAGFTEWRNVARAFPVFSEHNQPRFPGELGYYDLRIPEVMQQQIALAKSHGISAFCFHFYWFSGKTLLELPIDNFLRNRALEFKFCLCWANENWTRRWDGADQELLIGQSHSPEDDIALIRYLMKYFDDPRYLRIQGKPVLTVYRASVLPDAKATVNRWRKEVERAGFPGIYLIATNSFGFWQYQKFGFDALSEFPPHGLIIGTDNSIVPLHPNYRGRIYSYAETLTSIKAASGPADGTARSNVLFPGVMPSWDNTPRQPLRGHVFHGSTPTLFYEWLMHSISCARRNREGERIVFINAWNEWAEGAYLEPDRKFGYAYLAACASALSDSTKADCRVTALFERQRERFRATHRRAIAIHIYYADLARWFAEKVKDFGGLDVYITVPKTITWETAQAVTESFSSAYLLEVENRGRDIRPFFVMYPRLLESDYEFVCKLHSKKSPHLSRGDRWREDLVGQLLGVAARDALSRYQSRSSVGILAPRGSLESLADPSIRLRSEKNLVTIAKRLNYEMTFRESFVAGSMFWFRPSALRNLYKLFTEGLEFEPELGQVDGTIAHAIERTFCMAAKAAGMSIHEFGDRAIERPSRWM
jgi:lipopolysaccharide biosynthesis protein